MKPFRLAVAVALLLAAASLAQERSRLYSHPLVPPPEVLDRLNLRLAWRTVIPTLGKCDGIFSVQILEDLILVQDVSGAITAINPADGSQVWHTVFGVPFRTSNILGYNATTVFAYNGLRLFGLDRRTGVVRWEFATLSSPTAAPVADNDRVFLALLGGRLEAYLLQTATPAEVAATPPVPGEPPPEQVGLGASAVPPAAAQRAPRYAWYWPAPERVERAPLLTPESLLVADQNGALTTLNRESPLVANVFQANAPLSAPIAGYGDVAYFATQDASVYAMRAFNGNVFWRYTARSPVLRRPAVTDQDVYIGGNVGGLSRLDRLTGEELWRFPEGDRFAAANPTFVYAVDRDYRLVVIDRLRGTVLSGIDARDWPVAISNEVTDRLYLAAHDGTLICLYDRNYPAPVFMRRGEAAATPALTPRGEAPPPRPKATGEGQPGER